MQAHLNASLFTDGTADVAYEYSKNFPLNVLRLERNVGKGGAVRNGVLCARGELILFADADGATQFKDLEKLERNLRDQIGANGDTTENSALVIGSRQIFCLNLSLFEHCSLGCRAHLEKESIVQRSAFRTFLMFGFHTMVKIFAVRTINDTQCGFKLFTRRAAAKVQNTRNSESAINN